MKIRNLEVSAHQPCRIIAELGTLHLSSYDNMMKATRDAIDHGADMVKVQMINPETSWWATEKQIQRYKRLTWSEKEWVRYFEEANAIAEAPAFSSIFCTSFLTKAILEVMPAWKLGYKALWMPDLIEKTIATGIPAIFSIGGREDTQSMLVKEQIKNASNVLFQYVQPIYPLDSTQLILPKFGDNFDHQGLSIHSQDYDIFGAAIMLGAQSLEVHVQGDDAEGGDTAFALTMNQLKRRPRAKC